MVFGAKNWGRGRGYGARKVRLLGRGERVDKGVVVGLGEWGSQ